MANTKALPILPLILWEADMAKWSGCSRAMKFVSEHVGSWRAWDVIELVYTGWQGLRDTLKPGSLSQPHLLELYCSQGRWTQQSPCGGLEQSRNLHVPGHHRAGAEGHTWDSTWPPRKVDLTGVRKEAGGSVWPCSEALTGTSRRLSKYFR